ncbi:MAG TPA: EamA family transporter [Ignavibacteriaceae bacterium]
MNKFAPIFVIVAASLWAVDGIALRPILYSLPVPLVVFIESTIVAVLLTPVMAKNFGKLKALNYGDWLAFAGVALLGGAIGTMAITKALFYVDYVNLTIVVLIQKLQPVFALTLAGILLKEKLSGEFFLWAFIAIVGAYLMTFGFTIPSLDSGEKTTLAALFSLLAAFSFGTSTVLSKRALKNVGFEMGTYLRFVFSAVIMVVIVLAAGNIKNLSDVSSTQFYIFILIAFTTGGTAIFLYYYGLKKITASVATICELSFPLTAVLLEYFIRGNILNPVQWIGVLVLLFSIIRVTQLNSKNNKTA